MRVLLAGASGVIGRALLPLLLADGHQVTALTRRGETAAGLAAAGADPVICDLLDPDATARAVAAAACEAVVHQATDLPQRYADLRRGTATTDRLRIEATRNLLVAAAAGAAPVQRIVAQSIAFAYAPAAGAAAEGDPLWTDAPGGFSSTVDAVGQLETMVTAHTGGIVLRYGNLYGPGTWFGPTGDVTDQVRKRRFPIVGDGGGMISWLHPRDAASATVRALHGPPGVYNVVDDTPVSYADFLREFALLLGARPPRRVPPAMARLAAGPLAVAITTGQRAAANARARSELGWVPDVPDWRAGFAADFGGS